MGIGAAFAALSCLKLASSWFAHKQFALLTGLLLSIGLFGSILGEGPLLYLVQYYAWRHALKIVAIFGFVIVFLIILVVRDGPRHATSKNDTLFLPH